MFVEAGVSLGRSSHRRSGAYSLLVAKPCLPQRSGEDASHDGPRLKALLPAGLRVVPIGKWDTGRGFIQPLSQRGDQRAESGSVSTSTGAPPAAAKNKSSATRRGCRASQAVAQS